MEWLDASEMVLNSGNGSTLELITGHTESKSVKYTCRVTSEFGNQSKTLSISLPSLEKSSSTPAVAIYSIVVIIALLIISVAIIVIIFIVRWAIYIYQWRNTIIITISYFRKKNRGKLLLHSDRVKSKTSSKFLTHATQLKSDGSQEKSDEKIELASLSKSDSSTYRGNTIKLNVPFFCFQLVQAFKAH